MKSIAFVFTTSPHTTAAGREALDAVLATSAYSENLSLFFIGDGVSQLLKHQQPQSILSRDYISAFRLLDLYEVEDLFVCDASLNDFGFSADDLFLDAQLLSGTEIAQKLAACDVVLRF
ncbi:sulfurtransferase complex subunit TusC [Vibrio sp. B1Z05]|uniref:sulfurtransferase complex subunit TusC n=1 Tax=Vibrio sp. B1Z05 TaxID=2654980 RepID=UPI00128B953F|nr:sulfurtransferase complex subunit TusC [Vibrio sp. B1Z05]MPW37580.1 sulfurtransferase complex subunit TusC [Vibrio sp. B1Z05]